MAGTEDESLLDKARRGNQDAFLLLYQRYHTQIFRFVYRLIWSTEVAEDIVHDCFLNLLRTSELAPVSVPIRLYSRARNYAMKFLSNSGASGKDRSESSTDEDNAALAVAKGVAQLPILEREALILREYERLELDEIAAIVGADTKTVTDRLANARQRLRKSLANHLLA